MYNTDIKIQLTETVILGPVFTRPWVVFNILHQLKTNIHASKIHPNDLPSHIWQWGSASIHFSTSLALFLQVFQSISNISRLFNSTFSFPLRRSDITKAKRILNTCLKSAIIKNYVHSYNKPPSCVISSFYPDRSFPSF